MKITFVGSSHGVPEANRKCTCIMLEVGANVYFIDMGTNAIDALRTKGISVDAVKGVFITHMHGDHTNGLIPFVDVITWYFKTPDPVIYLPMIEAAQALDQWLHATLTKPHADKQMQYRQTEPGMIFDDGVIKVTAIATQHCLKSFAYLVEAEGKKILFTGDLKRPGVDFPEIAKQTALDLVVCESAHFPATEYLQVFEQCDIKDVCVTHYSDRFHGSVLELKNIMKEQGKTMMIASDDFEIRL